jgi:hypothetical protein
MSAGRYLIQGKVGEGDKIWPPDWPCLRCGKVLSNHVQLGEPEQEATSKGYYRSATMNWCHRKNDPENRSYIFDPVDNLTYVELKDKERIS